MPFARLIPKENHRHRHHRPSGRDPENGLECAHGTVGFDCTGLTLYAVYQVTGILLPHGKGQNSGHGGTPVAQSELEPGDIVFFGPTLANYTHSGIYAGGGKMWDAQTEGEPVKMHSLYSNYVGATRYWH
jgi:peptidoglycan DL-endopeptidase CwlO